MLPDRYKKLGFTQLNSPKKTPNAAKSHAVVIKNNGNYELIRFAQQGIIGSPKKEGESEFEKNRRNSFQARHLKNIAKGKTSAAYWSNKEKWEDGGEISNDCNPNYPYHLLTNPCGYKPKIDINELLNPTKKPIVEVKEKYVPSKAILKTKAALAAASLTPYVGYVPQVLGAIGDIETSARYALDGQWAKAGEDLLQAGIGLIPGTSYASAPLKINKINNSLKVIKALKAVSDIKTIDESFKKGGYINNNGRYVHKDGKSTSKPGLWSNVYMKNKKYEGGGGVTECPEGMIWDEITQTCVNNYLSQNKALNFQQNLPNALQKVSEYAQPEYTKPQYAKFNDTECFNDYGESIPCKDENLGTFHNTGSKADSSFNQSLQKSQSAQNNASNFKTLNKKQYKEPNYVAPLAFNSLISGMFNNYNNNINSNNVLNTSEFNNPYDNKFTQYNKCGGKVFKKMMKSGGFVKYEDGGETRSEIQEERQQDIGLRQQQLNVFFNKEEDSQQSIENPYVENINQDEINIPINNFYKPQEIETTIDTNFKVNSTEAMNSVGKFYLNKGYNKEFVAGVLGNIYAESNGKSNITELKPTSGKGGFGLFQHTGKRRKQLFDFAQKNNLNPSDPITQAMFAEQEPDFQNAYKAAQGKTAGESAIVFENKFERAGIKRLKTRVNAANNFYNKL
jgi:Phage tail lysozyme